MGRTKKYNSYKSTEIAWLPKAPSHWEVVDTKRCFYFPKEIVGSAFNDYKVLSLSINGVIFRNMASGAGKQHSDLGTYQIIRPNSIVLCLFDMDVTPRIVGHSDKTGIITSAYINISPKQKVNSKYYYYYFLLQDFNKYLFSQGTGIRTTLTRSQFGALKIALPTHEEQTAIAKFLDYKLSKVNRFIHKKKQLIKLLNEQKTAIINQAVTKGIDPNAKMKDSGIEWLGEIPEHWEVRKLKYVAEVVNGSTPKSDNAEYWNGDIIWLTPEDVSQYVGKSIYSSNRKITTLGFNSCGTSLVPAGSVVLTTRAPIGNICKAGVALSTNQGCKAIVIKDACYNVDYLMFFLMANSSKLQLLGRGTTFMELSTYSLRSFPLLYHHEFDKIIIHIQKETASIQSLISQTEKEIALVEEYKTALIAEAVTGKIDVRGFEVPEMVEEENYEEIEEEVNIAAEGTADYEIEETL